MCLVAHYISDDKLQVHRYTLYLAADPETPGDTVLPRSKSTIFGIVSTASRDVTCRVLNCCPAAVLCLEFQSYDMPISNPTSEPRGFAATFDRPLEH